MELANGVVNKSKGFKNHYALAGGQAAGGDKAYLSGSPQDDTFVAGDGYAYMYGAAILNSTRQFEAVEAEVTSDGYDKAALYDTAGLDRFYGGLSESRFELSSNVVNTAKGAFDIVYAYATPGTSDEAYLSGTAAGDTFVGGQGYAYLTGAGKTNSTRQFDYVEADVSGSGGTDKATLYDSTGSDQFVGQTSYGELTAATYRQKAIGFSSGKAIAIEQNDSDTATLYSGTPWTAIDDWENVVGPLSSLSDGDLESLSRWLATSQRKTIAQDNSSEDPHASAVDLIVKTWAA
jgi:hypothetical protein